MQIGRISEQDSSNSTDEYSPPFQDRAAGKSRMYPNHITHPFKRRVKSRRTFVFAGSLGAQQEKLLRRTSRYVDPAPREGRGDAARYEVSASLYFIPSPKSPKYGSSQNEKQTLHVGKVC